MSRHADLFLWRLKIHFHNDWIASGVSDNSIISSPSATLLLLDKTQAASERPLRDFCCIYSRNHIKDFSLTWPVWCLHHLTSSVQEWFILRSVLKVFEKFAFKVPAHVITQPSDLLRVMSLWSCLFFPSFWFFLSWAFPVVWSSTVRVTLLRHCLMVALGLYNHAQLSPSLGSLPWLDPFFIEWPRMQPPPLIP